jgi:D-3-phosphoglycerate dehydrogenase / 2-oxoglutarate reductase
MKVLISDNFSREGLQLFEQADGIEIAYLPGIPEWELKEAIVDADALVVRGGTQVNEELLAAAKQLRVVGRAGIGVENMDMAALNRKGVVVMNTPFGSTTTTAEHTLAMLMTLARQIPAAHASIKEGLWEKERFLGVEISGKTLGVIGCGKIGRLVIERALALQMKVLVYDPYLTPEVVRQIGGEQVEFQELLRQSDFITLHIPLNTDTENLLNAETLAQVKPGCRIINCATGGLIDEAALARAITSGAVAGAAIDVFAKEPPGEDNPLLALDQVVCTPHLRAATVDAQVNVTLQVARQIIDFLQRGIVINALNVPAVNADILEHIRPFVNLAEKLGSFLAQIGPKSLQRITIEYAGATIEYPTAPVTMAVLKGLLTPMIGSIVNYVNAPHLARERGLHVVETKSSKSEGYSNLIRLTLTGTDGENSVSGALFGTSGRIIRIDDMNVEAIPDGHILVLYNNDRPGVVGHIGQLLGEAGINIAQMNLSRGSGRALSLINVDSRISEELLARIRTHESVLSAIQAHL